MRTPLSALTLTLTAAALAAPATAGAITPPHAGPPWTAPAALADGPVAAGPEISIGSVGSVGGAYGDGTGVHYAGRLGLKGPVGRIDLSSVPGESVQYRTGQNGTVVAWIEDTGADGKQVFAAVTKPDPQYGFSKLQEKKRISTGSSPVSQLVLETEDAGHSGLAWVQNVSGIPQVFAARAKVNEDFEAPVQVSNGANADESGGAPDLDIRGGRLTVAYTQGNGIGGGLHAEVVRVRAQTVASPDTFTGAQILGGGAGLSALEPTVTLDAGVAWVAWSRNNEVEARSQQFEGGAWGSVQTLSDDPATGAASSPEAVGWVTHGVAITWVEEDSPGGTDRVRLATSAPAGLTVVRRAGFLSPPGVTAEDVAADLTPFGTMVVAYRGGGFVWATRRADANADFTEPAAVSIDHGSEPSVGSVPGNDIVAWRDDATGAFLYAGYDYEEPHLVDFGPSSVTIEAGKPRQWIVSTVEPWSDATTTWSFGDGSPDQQGEIVSHTYTTPGTYTQTATAVDWIGLTSSRSRTVKVTPPVIGDPPPPPPPANVAPTGTVGKLAKKVKASKLKGFSGTASDDRGVARVEIALVSSAKRKGKVTCKQLTGPAAKFGSLKPDKKKRCVPTRYLRASGTSKWTYKLTKKLPAGSYALSARVVDTDGAVTTLKTLAFRVVK